MTENARFLGMGKRASAPFGDNSGSTLFQWTLIFRLGMKQLSRLTGGIKGGSHGVLPPRFFDVAGDLFKVRDRYSSLS